MTRVCGRKSPQIVGMTLIPTSFPAFLTIALRFNENVFELLSASSSKTRQQAASETTLFLLIFQQIANLL